MKNLILQGLPGVGKTTLIKKIADHLKQSSRAVSGFYTEELRDDHNTRIGFDVVTLEGLRGVLARKISSNVQGDKYKVGNYNVQLEDFEKIALDELKKSSSILIIDEIGKMELFSTKFENLVEQLIADSSLQIIATVPSKPGLKLVQKIKTSSNSHLITVTKENRDRLLNEILPLL